MKKMIQAPTDNMVQSMRVIRDEVSNEIKDMTFAEQRAYLDSLLAGDNPKQTTTQFSKNKKSQVA